MTRSPLPLRADDLSTFARALSTQLGDTSPSHLSLMNMLARSAGFQNVQHMRAVHAAGSRLARETAPPPGDHRLVARALRQFDGAGRLTGWPARRAVQTLALHALWSVIPPETAMTETEVNALLGAEHLFGDPATLRRTMISCGLLSRSPDGSNYRRIEQAPPPEARELIAHLKPRRALRVTKIAGAQDLATPEAPGQAGP